MDRTPAGIVLPHLARLTVLSLLGLLGVLVLLAGCGGYGGYGGAGSPSGSSPSGPAQVNTATATVKGQSTTILTTHQGLTLYYRTSDTASASTCTGSCAGVWPPLLTSGSPVATSSLPGTLSSLSDANGTQVTYNGHPLYTYSGDSHPGDTNGEGFGGVWFVATPDLATQGPGGGAPTPTTGRYGY
jgi:predicted lipoprotein with Yx(FWY)xxD motif